MCVNQLLCDAIFEREKNCYTTAARRERIYETNSLSHNNVKEEYSKDWIRDSLQPMVRAMVRLTTPLQPM